MLAVQTRQILFHIAAQKCYCHSTRCSSHSQNKPRFFRSGADFIMPIKKQTLSCLLRLSKKSSKSWAFIEICGKIKAVMKVIVKQRENREQVEIFSIEEFVPADHLLRKNRKCDRFYLHI